jgi:hypothetical protein
MSSIPVLQRNKLFNYSAHKEIQDFNESGPNHLHVTLVVPFFVVDHPSRPFRWSELGACRQAAKDHWYEKSQKLKVRTSFKILVDLVRDATNAVSWTSSYSCLCQVQDFLCFRTGVRPTVSNSSLKCLFSEAGKDATRAATDRRIPWSGRACPGAKIRIRAHRKEKNLPAITSVTYFKRIKIRSCNIFIAERWFCRCDSTEEDSVYNLCSGKSESNSQLVPLPPPFAVQSTAMRSASPVSTL